MNGCLVTESNQRFNGDMFGYQQEGVVGELIFNTSMTGYEEILTDPSYAGQIIVFTYPHIGNTGINFEDRQSKKIYARGVIVRDYVETYSNHRAKLSLGQWLEEERIPGISGVDTRTLVRLIRERGNLKARIGFEEMVQGDMSQDMSHLSTETMVQEAVNIIAGDGLPIVMLDFGIKQGIVEVMANKGVPVILMPGDSTLEAILSHMPRAVIYSNGPGDPHDCTRAIQTARQLLKYEVPMYGICLGFQILSLALGAKTQKLTFGHHGANHPVKDLETRRVMITSQNHNYEVLESSFTSDVTITHRSLFDSTVQGFKHRYKVVMGFQGHPEASPGPSEAKHVFEDFINQVVS